MSFLDESNRLEFERLERQAERDELQKAIVARDGIPESTVIKTSDARFKRTTTGESVWGAIKNLPIVQTVQALSDSITTERDPSFDAISTATHVGDDLNLSAAEVGRLSHANNREEFDLIRENQIEQRGNQELASKTAAGTVTQFAGGLLSLENALVTVGTMGIGAWGVAAKSVRQGMMANTIRGVGTAGTLGYVGAKLDAQANTALSHEDVAWSTAISAIAGGFYTKQFGNVYKNLPVEAKRLNDVGGAIGQSMKAMFARSVGKGMEQYKVIHGDKYFKQEKLKRDVIKKETGIHRADIGDVDFNTLHATDGGAFTKEVKRFNKDNDMDLRRENITEAEKSYDKLTPLRSEAAILQHSDSPMAKAAGIVLYESGTNSVVKNDTAGVLMERFSQVFGYGYTPNIRNNFKVFRKRIKAENGESTWQSIKNYTKHRKAYDEEIMFYMDDVRAGVKPVAGQYSDEVLALADDLNKNNRLIHGQSQNSGLTGWDKIKYKDGYVPRKHMPVKYRGAIAKFGEATVIRVIQKALMSQTRGIGLGDLDEAEAVAKAFVTQFTTNPSAISAGNVMQDDAWDILQDVFKQRGIQLDDSLKAVFSQGVRERGKELTKVRNAKRRIPLDLRAESSGLRMIDLIDTDVESLYKGYAMSMAGHVALASKGIPDKQTWDKLRNQILKEDPTLESALDRMYETFSTGRIAGGVQSTGARLAVKGTVLSMLNTMGLTQLTETGTATATYMIRDFMKSGTEAMSNMFTGKTSVASTKLADEVMDSIFPIGKEHLSFPSHLAEEVNDVSVGNKFQGVKHLETALNAGVELQGTTSLFNAVRSLQHQTAFNMLMHKIGRYTHGNKKLDKQLASLGISENLFDGIKANLKKHGKLNKDGTVDMLGFNKWEPKVYDNLINAVVRNQSGIVQKALAGEGSAWMSRDMGALLFQFRKFPVESVRKQFLRKHTIDDKLLLTSMVHNTVIAGSVITARNYLNGSNTEADFDTTLRNGISYNADLGSVAMAWDLGISLTGAPDAMYVNPYSAYGSGVFQVPAISMMNNMANLGATATDSLDGDLDADSYRSLRALPIVGNIPLLGALMRDK